MNRFDFISRVLRPALRLAPAIRGGVLYFAVQVGLLASSSILLKQVTH
jgi:hypothetical protein